MNSNDWNDHGIALAAKVQYPAALAAFARSVHLEPRADNLANYSNVLRMLWRFEEAEHYLKKSFAIAEGRPRSWWIDGMLALDQHQSGRAIASLDKAVPALPEIPQALFTRACAKLYAGRFLDGFKDYEIRLNIHKPTGLPPMWQGENLAGKILLVDAEQGMGDAIMFARYLNYFNVQTIFRVPGPLLRYFRSQGYPAVKKACSVRADYRAMSMSLPVIMNWDECPEVPEPQPPEPMTLPNAGKFRVGLVWRSKAAGLEGPEAMHHGWQKSCPFEEFLTLAEIPGVQLFSLQVGQGANDVNKADKLVEPLLIDDFEDMAGYMKEMDYIVSVDTGPAHLAGALKKPGVVLLNAVGSWQWGAADKSPWYPSLDLVRQPKPFDWTGAMAIVRQKIESLTSSIAFSQEQPTIPALAPT